MILFECLVVLVLMSAHLVLQVKGPPQHKICQLLNLHMTDYCHMRVVFNFHDIDGKAGQLIKFQALKVCSVNYFQFYTCAWFGNLAVLYWCFAQEIFQYQFDYYHGKNNFQCS